MPYRLVPLVQGETYHVFNRSVGRQPIFLGKRDYQRALETIRYYSYQQPPVRFSYYNRLPVDIRVEMFARLKKDHLRQVQLMAYCLIPNHVHFLTTGVTETGIQDFMRNFQNSYAKYFNTKTERSGALWQSMFKAVRIESNEQLLHVCRYIHLNPFSSHICKTIEELEDYPWSSLGIYLGKKQSDIINPNPILELFNSVNELKGFTRDQADYQKDLSDMKHLLLE